MRFTETNPFLNCLSSIALARSSKLDALALIQKNRALARARAHHVVKNFARARARGR